MNPNEIQKIFQTVVKSVRCPHCGKRYSYDNIHVVSSAGSVYFLQLECLGHVPMLATVSVNTGSGKIEEVVPITSDEVILAYKEISNTTSFKKIFE